MGRQRHMTEKREMTEEKKRLEGLFAKERALTQAGYPLVAGIDEAGRGPLAGPVVAACVILKPDCKLWGLNDSKKLTPRQRERLAAAIKEEAISFGIGVVDHQEIDRINILQATIKAMEMAVTQLDVRPDYLLIDALGISSPIPQEKVIKGDSTCACIAAASILAKTYRDSLMVMMDTLYPLYGFKDNKGYGTPRHREALLRYGPCAIHRKSFLHLDSWQSSGENEKYG